MKPSKLETAGSTGWGLIIDAVAAETGLLSKDKAKERATLTMQNINTNWPRDANGFFSHWTDERFQYAPMGEYSTIDSAIMVSGAYFAANYFNDPQLIQLAKSIGSTPDYSLIFNDGWDVAMFMNSKGKGSDGKAVMDASTTPFNEYYMLAYLAKLHEKSGNKAKNYFEELFGTSGKPVGRGDKPHFTNYNGHEMMSDVKDHRITTFTVQFPFFASKGFHDNPWYTGTLYPSWYQAERDFWTRSDGANVNWQAVDASWGVSGIGQRAFGTGAGDSPAGYFPQDPF